MKRRVWWIIASAILVIGIGFLLFAPVSNSIGRMKSNAAANELDRQKNSAVDSYTIGNGEEITTAKEAIEAGCADENGRPVTPDGKSVMFSEDIERLKADSIAYNGWLLTHQGEYETTQYGNMVFLLEDYGIYDGVYCYLEAPAIGLRLPVYLGASEYLMSYGAAHLYGTSLPVGEGDHNAAIAGHTGYIGRIFFDNLRSLSIGDEVSVTTYWGTDSYRVTDTMVVSQDDTQPMTIQEGRKLLTLITCISDGEGGFDRYLVICEKNQP